MSDADLDRIRQQRMAQMQSQYVSTATKAIY